MIMDTEIIEKAVLESIAKGYRNFSDAGASQLVDDVNRKTIATVTSVAKKYDDFKKSHNGKVDLSRQIGVDVAETAKKLKISTVVFDRNGYQYHGRVKAVAEGARESGLQF